MKCFDSIHLTSFKGPQPPFESFKIRFLTHFFVRLFLRFINLFNFLFHSFASKFPESLKFDTLTILKTDTFLEQFKRNLLTFQIFSFQILLFNHLFISIFLINLQLKALLSLSLLLGFAA